jgi:hypothetical protein
MAEGDGTVAVQPAEDSKPHGKENKKANGKVKDPTKKAEKKKKKKRWRYELAIMIDHHLSFPSVSLYLIVVVCPLSVQWGRKHQGGMARCSG